MAAKSVIPTKALPAAPKLKEIGAVFSRCCHDDTLYVSTECVR